MRLKSIYYKTREKYYEPPLAKVDGGAQQKVKEMMKYVRQPGIRNHFQ